MTDSLLNCRSRKQVIKSEVRKHFRVWKEAELQGRSIYRTMQNMGDSKEANKLLKKCWFKQRRGGLKVKEAKWTDKK